MEVKNLVKEWDGIPIKQDNEETGAKAPPRVQEILLRGRHMKDESHKVWDRIGTSVKRRKAAESIEKVIYVLSNKQLSQHFLSSESRLRKSCPG